MSYETKESIVAAFNAKKITLEQAISLAEELKGPKPKIDIVQDNDGKTLFARVSGNFYPPKLIAIAKRDASGDWVQAPMGAEVLGFLPKLKALVENDGIPPIALTKASGRALVSVSDTFSKLLKVAPKELAEKAAKLPPRKQKGKGKAADDAAVQEEVDAILAAALK